MKLGDEVEWTKTELLNKRDRNFNFRHDLEFQANEFSNYQSLLGLKDVHVIGEAYFEDSLLTLTLNLNISGIMLVPCAITLKETEYAFEIKGEESISFLEDVGENIQYNAGEVIELKPIVKEIIVAEVPFKVVSISSDKYPTGKGWEVITEKQLQDQDKKEIDPRLAKLLEFQIEDD